MGKSKHIKNQSQIWDYLTTDFAMDDEMKTPVEDVKRTLDLLVDNRVAIKLSLPYYTTDDASPYYVGSLFMIKYNKSLKKAIMPREYIATDSSSLGRQYIDQAEEIVELGKYMLFPGSYFAQLSDDIDYAVFIVEADNASGDDEHYYSYNRITPRGTSLYFVGPHKLKYFKKYFELFNKYQDIIKKTSIEVIYNRTINESYSEVQFKKFERMIFKEKEFLINYVDHFIENIPRYYSYGITPKLSILLYGGVGCGKTSCAQALAKHLDLKSIQCINADYFTSNESNQRRMQIHHTMYALDDIDCICNSREDDKSMENKAIMKQLLAFLDAPPPFYFKAKDGIYYPISIVVATTNYYDKLDPAVSRYGRFDLQLHMSEFDAEDAEGLCKLYGLHLKDVIPDYDHDKKFKISPAQMDALCMSKIDKGLKDTKNEEVRNNELFNQGSNRIEKDRGHHGRSKRNDPGNPFGEKRKEKGQKRKKKK